MDDFMKITKIPIVVYYGDNIPKGDTPVANWGEDTWRIRWNLAKNGKPWSISTAAMWKS